MSAPAPTHRQAWLNAYERRTSPALSGLAVVYLVTYSIQSLWHDPGTWWFAALVWFGAALWILFALDLLLRLAVAEHRAAFLRRNWLDTITVVVPQLRALRTLRIFTKNGVLSKGKGSLSRGAIATAALATALLVWIGSLSVLNAERGAAGADITSIGDAVWWAFETITTVGYGDYVPVTLGGRVTAVMVMFAGVSALSVISAGLAATLVKQGATPASPAQEVMDELRELKRMVASMQAQLESGSVAPSPGRTVQSAAQPPSPPA
ncbi:MAG: potassium channel family protein [Actinomycetales bacterium]